MGEKIVRVLMAGLVTAGVAGVAAADVLPLNVADYQSDYVAGTSGRTALTPGDTAGFGDLGTGWAYLWNAPTGWVADDYNTTSGTGGSVGDLTTGAIGTTASYRPLVWATEVNSWTADGDGGGGAGAPYYNNSRPAGYVRIASNQGHPGRGPELTINGQQNVERFAIVGYEIQAADGAGFYAITASSILRTSNLGDGDRLVVHVDNQPFVLDIPVPSTPTRR